MTLGIAEGHPERSAKDLDGTRREGQPERPRGGSVKKRRSRGALEDAVEQAGSARGKAIALFELALFHDNNSREAEAIPLYETALGNGLPTNLKAQALTWLASSLYKTGDPKRAMMQIRRAREVAKSHDLRKFLDGLETRVHRSIRKS